MLTSKENDIISPSDQFRYTYPNSTAELMATRFKNIICFSTVLLEDLDNTIRHTCHQVLLFRARNTAPFRLQRGFQILDVVEMASIIRAACGPVENLDVLCGEPINCGSATVDRSIVLLEGVVKDEDFVYPSKKKLTADTGAIIRPEELIARLKLSRALGAENVEEKCLLNQEKSKSNGTVPVSYLSPTNDILLSSLLSRMSDSDFVYPTKKKPSPNEGRIVRALEASEALVKAQVEKNKEYPENVSPSRKRTVNDTDHVLPKPVEKENVSSMSTEKKKKNRKKNKSKKNKDVKTAPEPIQQNSAQEKNRDQAAQQNEMLNRPPVWNNGQAFSVNSPKTFNQNGSNGDIGSNGDHGGHRGGPKNGGYRGGPRRSYGGSNGNNRWKNGQENYNQNRNSNYYTSRNGNGNFEPNENTRSENGNYRRSFQSHQNRFDFSPNSSGDNFSGDTQINENGRGFNGNGNNNGNLSNRGFGNWNGIRGERQPSHN
uniref:Uncharacterized protein n=1 Tax=Caenorhabditis japonica TaxID=281687 RepID=A0A8R1DZ93_CAEJA